MQKKLETARSAKFFICVKNFMKFQILTMTTFCSSEEKSMIMTVGVCSSEDKSMIRCVETVDKSMIKCVETVEMVGTAEGSEKETGFRQ